MFGIVIILIHTIIKFMLEVKNICKNFENFEVLKDLNFSVSSSEICVFLGVNGAGKTTTMKILAGILKPTSGDIIIDNVNFRDDERYCKSITGYIQDRPYFYEKLSVREFLRFIGGLYELNKDVIEDRIKSLLAHYQIENKIDSLIESLSHGMRQRLSICAGLIHEPKLLIIDEPMVGLDPYGAKLLKDSLKEYARNGMAILVSTHSLDVAEELADKILIIDKGKIIKNTTLKEIKEDKNYSSLEELFINITNKAI